MSVAIHSFITKEWVMAGKAIFTVHNNQGDHYTFRVLNPNRNKPAKRPVWWLAVLTGGDNEDDKSYTYIGKVVHCADGLLRVELTAKSRYTYDSQIVHVAGWALFRICDGKEVPHGYGIDSCGKCGRCGHVLTHPDGVSEEGYRFGYGPCCWEIIQKGRR